MPPVDENTSFICPQASDPQQMKLWEMQPLFQMLLHLMVMVTEKGTFRWNVCCSLWVCLHIHCTKSPFVIVLIFPLPFLLHFSILLGNLCPCVSISSIQAPLSMEGLFPKMNVP